jgi:hypothetical protein
MVSTTWRWKRDALRSAFCASIACLPGEAARWIAQSAQTSAIAAGDSPPVIRASPARKA